MMTTLFADVAGLKATVTAMDDKIDQLNLYLRGNGQPGVIKDLRDADDRLSDRMDGVDVRISRWTGVSVGAWAMLTTIISVVETIRHWRPW